MGVSRGHQTGLQPVMQSLNMLSTRIPRVNPTFSSASINMSARIEFLNDGYLNNRYIDGVGTSLSQTDRETNL